MSADAKVWADDTGWWNGIHDGECRSSIRTHDAYALSHVLADIERCMHRQLRWEIFQFSNGPGLRGYET